MSIFFNKGLTDKGRALQLKAQAGTQLHYTQFKIGDGQLGGQSITSLTGMISVKKTLPVTRLKMTPPNQATVGFVITNQDITVGFTLREVGLFAQDPDEGEILYWYGNAADTADYLPPGTGNDLVEKNFDVLVFVGTAANVTATINNSLVYVTQQDLAEAIAGVDISPASLIEAGITKLSSATDSDAEDRAATPKAVKAAFTAGNERKAEVVAALVAIGVTASTSETWAQLIPKMAAVIRATGNAAVGDVRAGKTFSNVTGNNRTGTLTVQATAAQTVTPTASNIVKAAGIYDGAITISGVVVPAAKVLNDTTIAGVAGTMPKYTVNAAGTDVRGQDTAQRMYIRPPAGYWDGLAYAYFDDPDWIAANIRSGTNIFGLTGNLTPWRTATADIVSQEWTYVPSSFGTSLETPFLTLNTAALGFVPKIIIARQPGVGGGAIWSDVNFADGGATYYYNSMKFGNNGGSEGYRVPYNASSMVVPVPSNAGYTYNVTFYG